MNKKQIRILAPLGLLLVSLVVLVGCRPSTALTRLMNALEALNPSTEETHTEEEEAEDTSSQDMDPLDEERDDAKIEEMDILIGQLLEHMDEEEAEEAVRSLYQDLAESYEWGTQQYDPENLNSVNETGALALYIGDHNIRLESGRTNGTGTVLTGTGTEATEGVPSSSGTLQSSSVPITPDNELTPDADEGDAVEEPDDEESAGSGEDSNSPKEGDNPESLVDNPEDDPDTDLGGDGGDGDGDPDDADSPDDQTTEEEKGHTVFYSDTGYNIVATGQAAITVCMLGGADRLLATSPDFGANDLARRAFNSSGQMHYTTLWNNLSTDDGSEPMTSTDFNALLDLLDSLPEGSTTMVIEFSGSNTFSSSQLRTLSERDDIGYYALSNMYSIDTMKSVTESLAIKMDKSVEGTPAKGISDAYGDWVDAEVDTAASNSSNIRETVFIEDWDKNVETRFSVKYQYGGYNSQWTETGESVLVSTGAAVIRLGRSYRPLEECLMTANVFDWAACPHERPYINGFFKITEYGFGDTKLEESGDINEWYGYGGQYGTIGTSGFESQPGDYCYITPLYDTLNATEYKNSYSGASNQRYSQSGLFFSGGRDGIGVINDSYYKDGIYVAPSGLSYGNLCLGYSDKVSTWSTVVVKNQYIGEQLSSNFAWQTNSSTGKEYTTKTNNGNTKTLYCTPLSLYATSGYLYDMSCDSSIGGGYDIIVNPTGLGDWTGQSPEAILETVWAGHYLHQGYGDSSYLDGYAERRIKNFYETFYGLDLELAENQDILPMILTGPKN